MKKSPTRFIRRVDNKFTSASLDLNFQNMTPSSFDSRITFTRASNATYFDGSGILQTASTNVPRLDHSPTTRLPLGLLIEEQRTNSIRNNTMQGAVAGTPGTLPTNWTGDLGVAQGLTPAITNVSTVNGISTIDYRTSGTTTSGGASVVLCEGITQIAAISGQVWTGSYYLALIAGSLSNLVNISITIREYGSGGTFLRQTLQSVSTMTAALQRFTVSATLGANTVSVSIGLRAEYSPATAVDFTLRIGLPQLELGAFATSVIPTTTAAATRNADVATMTGTNFSSWYNATEGTLFTHVSREFSVPSGQFPVAFSINDGTTQNSITNLYITATLSSLIVRNTNTIQAELYPLVPGNALERKIASAFKINDFAVLANQGSILTDTSGTLPTVDRCNIGTNASGGAVLNGHIRRIAYWGVRLDNSKLQALTT